MNRNERTPPKPELTTGSSKPSEVPAGNPKAGKEAEGDSELGGKPGTRGAAELWIEYCATAEARRREGSETRDSLNVLVEIQYALRAALRNLDTPPDHKSSGSDRPPGPPNSPSSPGSIGPGPVSSPDEILIYRNEGPIGDSFDPLNGPLDPIDGHPDPMGGVAD